MKNVHLTFCIGFCGLVLVCNSSSVCAQQVVDHGVNVPSADEIIDHFAPVANTRPVRTRGLHLQDSNQPKHQSRSISLQVNFAYNSDQLTRFALDQLKPVGIALASAELSSLSFDLEGHTDAKGSESYNLDLSRRRAARVKQFFMERYGVNQQRIHATGRGEYELLSSSEPYSGVNRRVTVTANY